MNKFNTSEEKDLENLVREYKDKYKKRKRLSKLVESLHMGASLFVGYTFNLICDYGARIQGNEESNCIDTLLATFVTYYCTENFKNKFLYNGGKKFFNRKGISQKEDFLDCNKRTDRIFNWMYSHTNFIGACLGLLIANEAIPFIAYKNWDYITNQGSAEHLFYYNSIALGLYGLSIFATNIVLKPIKILHKIKRTGILTNYIKAGIYSLTNRRKEAAKEYLKAASKTEEQGVQSAVANYLIKYGQYDDALLILAKVPKLNMADKSILWDDDFYLFNRTNSRISSIKRWEKKLAKRFNDFSIHLQLAISNIIPQNYQTVQDYVTLACNVDPEHRTEANVIGSLIYEHVPIEGLAEEQWTKTIDLVLEAELSTGL